MAKIVCVLFETDTIDFVCLLNLLYAKVREFESTSRRSCEFVSRVQFSELKASRLMGSLLTSNVRRFLCQETHLIRCMANFDIQHKVSLNVFGFHTHLQQ